MDLADIVAAIMGKRVADEVEAYRDGRAIQREIREELADARARRDYDTSGQFDRDFEDREAAADRAIAAIWARFPPDLQAYPDGMLGPRPADWPADRVVDRTGSAHSRPYAFLGLLADGDYGAWITAIADDEDADPEAFELATAWGRSLRDADPDALEAVLRADRERRTNPRRKQTGRYCKRLRLGHFSDVVGPVCHGTFRTRPVVTPGTVEERLAALDALHERGVITAEESARKREEILASL